MDKDSFYFLHRPQFDAMSLPISLHHSITQKILNNQLDASEYVVFGVEEVDSDCSSNNIDNQNFGETDVPVPVNTDISAIDILNDELNITFPKKSLKLYAKQDIPAESVVFLIDHMWVTTFPQSRKQLIQYANLRERIRTAIGDYEGDDLWDHIWPHLNCFMTPDEEYTKWYMLDEVGIAIEHSNTPNFRCCPILIQPPQGQPYSISIAWSIVDIAEGEEITRDYLSWIPVDEKYRSIRMLGFLYPEQLPRLMNMKLTLDNCVVYGHSMPVSTGIDVEQPSTWMSVYEKLYQIRRTRQPLRIYCDRSDHLNESLVIDKSRFQIVSDIHSADVLYLVNHTVDESSIEMNLIIESADKSVKEINKSNKITSQYIWNELIITKDALAATIRSSHKSMTISNEAFPTWFPLTYDLSIESQYHEFIIHFISNYQLNSSWNYWIMKSHRGKQSLDYPISNNLSCLLRHCELTDRLACEYIKNPLLLEAKKFDLRYHVLIKSMKPLVIQRHVLFVVRWANYEYSLKDFEEYQKHFTVMNFLDKKDSNEESIRGIGNRTNIHPNRFIDLFNNEYSCQGISWNDDIQPKIDQSIRSLFEYVQIEFSLNPKYQSTYHPNSCWSVLQSPNIAPARCMFGVDVMVDDTYQPKILEVQWAPDCARAVELHSLFWDDVLGGLYLDANDNLMSL